MNAYDFGSARVLALVLILMACFGSGVIGAVVCGVVR